MAGQWLFRHSSPIQRDGVTRVVISDPHGDYPAVLVNPVTPTILRKVTFQTEDKPAEQHQTPAVQVPSDVTRRSGPPESDGQDKNSTPTDQPHPPSVTVSTRKFHRFRDALGGYYWFESQGEHPIDHPPMMAEAEEGDVFFYWVRSKEKCQMWMWRRVDTSCLWVGVEEGEKIVSAGGSTRFLVVTEGRQPSLVQAGTWEKQYKRRTTRRSMPPGSGTN
ncbi:hypothetical protein BU15DRAFT_82011 [Melanogaster broomeanus]|nr:hypothetical protein BU15DRAFT_82011 [Melanogaster broomeanus]